MKKNTLKIALFLTLVLITYSINAQTFYYEDFRYEKVENGFTIQKVALDGQAESAVGKRVGDIVGLNSASDENEDSNNQFDSNSRPTNRIPANVARDQRAISFTNTSGANETLANHQIEAWALMTNQDLSTANMPIVSFWTEQRYVKGGGATLTIWVSENYTHGSLPSTATWTNETANITGNIATSDVSPQTYVYGALDLSAYKGASVTVAFKIVSDNTAYSKDVSQHGGFYISDVKFAASKEDVENGAFSALNTSSSGQSGVFNTPSASISEANFSNTSKWADILTANTATPRLAENVTMPVGEGYKFEVASKYNPIAVSKVRYKLTNATSNKTAAAVESKWMVQGSNDDSTWDDLSDATSMFSNNSGTDAYSLTLTTTKAYRYYRFVLAEAWTPNQKYTALIELDFTVDSSVLSTKENVFKDAFTVYPNPSNNVLNISKSSINIKNVKLIDVSGKIIYNNAKAQPIQVSNFSKGLYILRIESNEGGIFSKKVVIN